MATPQQQRLIDTTVEIMGEPEPSELNFLHVVLAQCGLPYRQPIEGQRDYIRQNGAVTLILSSGYLLDPKTGSPTLQGIPYGAKARLLLIHLCTEAVRLQSPQVPIGNSMSAFMADLGMGVTGGKTGSIGRFKEQLNRMAGARIQLLTRSADKVSAISPAPVISRFDVWFPKDPKQRTLWPSTVTLSTEFFASLQNHALPLDPRAIRALQQSAMALDCYTWLAHRLPRVKESKGALVSWDALRNQFGPDYKRERKFREDFLEALKKVQSVYRAARLDISPGGSVRLLQSPPPIAPTTLKG